MADPNLTHIIKKLEEIERRLTRLEEKAGVEGREATAIPPLPPPTIGAPAEVPPPPAPAPVLAGEEKEIDWENVLGGNWLVKIGMAALVLGVGFFLKLAFDNNWIGETGRIVLGVLGGFSLIGLGEYWQKKYPLYAQILTGGGIVILYFTTYAAHAFYNLIPAYAAFGFMGLVTVVAGALALRYEKPTIAVIGMLGGFFAPFLFVKTVDEFTLILYTLVLNIGILLLSTVRNWRPLTLIGLIGSFLLFAAWHEKFYSVEKLWLAEGFLTTVFLIFAFATILWHFLWRKAAEPADLTLMTLNAAGYFAVSYFLLSRQYGEWMGFFAFALAVLYALLASAAFARAEKDFRLTLFLGGISLVFLTLAMPIQLTGSWITVAWAAEGLVLLFLGFFVKSYHLRVGALIAFALALVRLAFLNSFLRITPDYTVVFNERFLVFAAAIAAVFAGAVLYRAFRERIQAGEAFLFPLFLLGGNALLLWLLSMEVVSFFDAKIQVLTAQAREVIDPGSIPCGEGWIGKR